MILRCHLHPWDILLSQYVAGMQVFQSSGEKVRIEPVLITTPELIRGDSGDANAITRSTAMLSLAIFISLSPFLLNAPPDAVTTSTS